MSGMKESFGSSGSGGRGTWRDAKRNAKCPICRGDSWCSIRTDGAVVLCRREAVGAVKSKTDVDGAEFHVHVLNADADPYEPTEGPDRSSSADRASPEVLDQAYRLLLAELRLTDTHRDLLRARGLSDEEIKLRGYRSFPLENRYRIAKTLAERLGETVAHSIPGLRVAENDGRSYWALGGAVGILIPLRASTGEIVALKVRADDSNENMPRYTYVSSKSYHGPAAINAVHSPIPGDLSRETVRVTEGELKADIATVLSGVYTISFPGTGSCQRAIPVLRDLGTVKRILVAFDADYRTNKHVALAMVDFCRIIEGFDGIEWAIETWNPLIDDKPVKGIDDALVAKVEIRLHEGEAARALLADLDEKFRPKKTAKELAAEAKIVKARLAAEAVAEERKRSAIEIAEPSEPIAPKKHRVPRWHAPIPQYLALADHPELASVALRLIRSNSSEKLVYDREKFWRYDDATGLWNDIDEGEVFDELGRCSGIPVGGPQGEPFRVLAKDVRGAIDFASTRVGIVKKGFFDEASPGIAFTNGFVHIDENHVVSLTKHTASRRAVHGMPFAYDPEAKAPKWEKYLSEVFSFAHPDDREARINLIEEWIGAVVLGDITRYGICLLLIGAEGNNGKSVLLHVMEELVRLVHPMAVQAIPPSHWGNVHHLAGLDGCRLNSINEMPDTDIEAGEKFKAVVTGDGVDVARKYGDPYRMKPIAGQVFAANAAPGTRDQTGGFWRRWGVLTFERTFVGAEINMNLRHELVAEEMQGIAARVIAAAARLSARNRFILPESATAAKEAWKLESDQVRQFVNQCTRSRTQDEEELAAVAKDREHHPACFPDNPNALCEISAEAHIEMDERLAASKEAQRAIEMADGKPDENGMERKKRGVYQTTPQFAYDAYWQWTRRAGHQALTSQKFWKRLHVVCGTSDRKNGYRFFPFRLTNEWSERRVLPMRSA